MLTTTYAGLTDLGRQRSRNDDRWGADPAQGLYIVADGVGSTTHGDMAAELCVQLLPTYVGRHFAGADFRDGEVAARFGRAVVEMCTDLHARSQTDSQLAGAGTTLVTVIINDELAVIAHLGDSRAYLYRNQQMQRLTSDHTLVQAVVDAGELTEEEAAHHPKRSIVTRQVLMTPPAKPDVSVQELQPGDRILLCSDGLHGVVDDATLAAILTEHPDAADACQALIAAANQGGGPDNITTVVIDADGAGVSAPTPTVQPTVAAQTATMPAPVPQPSALAAPPIPVPPPPPQQQAVPPAPPAGHVPPRMGPPPPQPPQPPSRRRGLKWALVGLVVVLLAGAGVGYLLWGHQPASQPRATQTGKPSAQAPAPATSTLQSLQPDPALGRQITLPFGDLKNVKAVAVDGAGTVYVLAVKGDKTVVLKLIKGQSEAVDMQFGDLKGAYGIAVDQSGKNVYVTDRANNGRLMRWTEGSTEAGELPLRMQNEGKLKTPYGVAVAASGVVYVVDTEGNQVVKVQPDASGDSPNATALHFTGLHDPVGVAVNSNGDVYVVDHSKNVYGKNRLVKLPAGSDKQVDVPATDLDELTGVAVNGDDVYITDRHDHQVLKVSAGSTTPTILPFTGVGRPSGVAIDSSGNVYVTDDETRKVLELPAG